MTEHWSLALQVAADTTRAYGEFPLIGARAAVWIAAEVHLMFAAFVLGVPMFAVVAEAIGIFGKEARYDRLAKEFTRLLLVAYSATAIWGAILVFFLVTLYPRFWAYLTAVFAASMWVFAGLFLFESFHLYLYSYDWMGYVGNFIAISALIVLPFAGYWLGREVYQYDQSMGITMMGGFMSWLWVIQAFLIAVLFLAGNYYLWIGMGRIPGAERFRP